VPCRRAVLLCVAMVLSAVAAPAVADGAPPSITVAVGTSPLTNGSHTGLTITARCASGRLVSGGSFLRLVDTANGGSSPGPGLPNVPSNGLVLGGTVPSTGSAAVDGEVADGTVDPTSWMTISNFTGQAEAGDQASTFALCASGLSHTVVKAASRTGANAQQATTAATDANLLGASPPILTTATCPAGARLVGGGAMTSTPDTVNNGTTPGNNSNLKPLASYPSDSSGTMLAGGSSTADSWSAYGSSGANVGNPTDRVVAFAVCSTDTPPPPVLLARADTPGPLGQLGTTVLTSPVTCPAGTRLLAGGYRVDETVGTVAGLQPQQGFHMRGSYPTTGGATYPDGTNVEAPNGATDPSTWTSVGQLGGQNLGASQHMVQHGFALCGGDVAAPVGPVPPPGGGTPPPVVTPKPGSATVAQIRDAMRRQMTPKGSAAKISTLLTKGGAKLPFKALDAGKLLIEWYVTPAAKAGARKKPRRVLVARGTATFQRAGKKTVSVKLTKAGRRRLRGAKRVALTARGSFTRRGAKPIVATKSFVVTRRTGSA
jgi:hypothetical protein